LEYKEMLYVDLLSRLMISGTGTGLAMGFAEEMRAMERGRRMAEKCILIGVP
jgi:hypothetical protein